MIAYIDSSVLLRVALNQNNRLKEFSSVQLGFSSSLIKAESLRTIDRLAAAGRLSQADWVAATSYLMEAFQHLELIPISETVLERVGEPHKLSLGTLDAIHLFSAVMWRSQRKTTPQFLTHDAALGSAAQLFGFTVIGL
jgi:predicted nucleic acid-binding protein